MRLQIGAQSSRSDGDSGIVGSDTDGSHLAAASSDSAHTSRATGDYDRIGVVITGIVAGFGACLVYPLLAVMPHSWSTAAAVLGASFGPLLGAAAWGLREFVTLDRRRPSADLAAFSLALAGALVTAMLLVQAAVRAENEDPADDLRAVWLGLDVAWDVYLAVGTVLFALCAMGHPRLGRVFGLTGMLIGGGLLVLNLGTFPTPPDSAGLVDLGPLVGLWFFAVTVAMLRSLGWARARAGNLLRGPDYPAA
jgi:hypothetical protein